MFRGVPSVVLVSAAVLALVMACDAEEESKPPVMLTSGVSSGGGGAGGMPVDMCPNAPSCAPMQEARDVDGDGCGDECCWVACDVDMVLFDDNDDGCAERCGDKPCTGPDDCEETNCVTLGGTCDEPVAVCTIMGCMGLPGGCGCDGQMYGSACDAAEAGVILDLSGDACN